jgi:hypothetical protein
VTKYTDNAGDVWESAGDTHLRLVECEGRPVVDGELCPRDEVREMWGPLTLVDGEEPQDAPSAGLPRVTDVMDRAAVFQSAHALVTGLKWGESESPSVYDVLSVAKWLEGDA